MCKHTHTRIHTDTQTELLTPPCLSITITSPPPPLPPPPLQQYVQNRDDGRTVGTALLQAGFIHHVADEHGFQDKVLFYRFTADDMVRVRVPLCLSA